MLYFIGLIIFAAIVLVIRYIVSSIVNKGADVIEDAIKNKRAQIHEEKKQNGEDTTQSLADRYK